MRTLVMAITLLACTMPVVEVFARAPVILRHRTTVGDWRLDIRRDTFSGNISCRLRETHGRAYYQGQAIGFRFGRHRDVSGAVYQLDRGVPRVARDDLPELTALGTPIETGPLSNPTRGVVHIPWRQLSAVNGVSIQPAPGKRPRTFRLGSVRGLHELARARGCSPEARFVR